MTNPTQSSWEQAILSKMTNNGERLAVLESKLNSIEKSMTDVQKSMTDIQVTNQKIESLLGWLKWIGGAVVAIALSLIANFVYSLIA